VDRPEMVSGVVHVSGPFVVEGTIPPPMEIEEPETIKTTEAHTDYSGDHITRMLEAIKKEGTISSSDFEKKSKFQQSLLSKIISCSLSAEGGC
jgi:hypothetical protein